MAASSNLKLFGLDLGGLFGHFAAGWAEAMRWPLFARFLPVRVLRVLLPDGGMRSARDGVLGDPVGGAAAALPQALLLPEELVLRRVLRLPRLPAEQLRAAVELEARAAVPFHAQDLVWGYAAAAAIDGIVPVHVAISSRAQVERHRATFPRVPLDVEVWAPGQPCIVFQGFGQAPPSPRRRWVFWLLAVLVLLQLAALVLTPVVQARLLAIQAQRAQVAIQAQIAPQLELREQLSGERARLESVRQAVAQRAQLLPILDELTRLLPDDAALDQLVFEGRTIQLTGYAADAVALLQALGNSSSFKEVRATLPSTRSGTGQESFSFQITLPEPLVPTT